MILEKVFTSHRVQVFREAEKTSVDSYSVAEIADRLVTVEAHLSELRYAPPSVGDMVFLETAHPDAVYRATARVEATVRGETLQITLKPIGSILRVQRRRKLRVSAALPVRIDESVRGEWNEKPLILKTHDVSTGGVRFLSPRPLRESGDYRIALELGQGRIFSCDGRVTRTYCVENGAHDTALSFVNITRREAELMAKYLMGIIKQKSSISTACSQ